MQSLRRTFAAAALAGCLCLPFLADGPSAAAPNVFAGASADRGSRLIEQVGCGSCHLVPGIGSAVGLVGPPLDHMANRIFIAGLLRNTPENMVTWLMNPQKIVPNNAMPDMGLTEKQARDITAYLYTLK